MRWTSLVLILLGGSAIAADPLRFKGVELGKTPADEAIKLIDSSGRSTCLPDRQKVFCSTFNSVDYGPVRLAAFNASGVNDTIDYFAGTFDSDSYGSLKTAMTEKFGKPSCNVELVHNRMNAQFKDETCIWTDGKVQASIQRYGIDSSSSMLMFMTNEAGKRRIREFDARKKLEKSKM